MKAKHWILIGGGAVAVYALTRPKAMEVIGEAAKTVTKALGGGMTEDLKSAIMTTARQQGVQPSVLAAILDHETGGKFDPNAVAPHPGDLTRGGSYGIGQMSYATAIELGYKGPAPKPLPDSVVRAIRTLRPQFSFWIGTGKIPSDRWWTDTVDGKAAAKAASKVVQRAWKDRVWVPFQPGEGLLNPTANLALVAKYIKQIMKRWNVTDVREIAAVYNSGGPIRGYVSKTTGKMVYPPQTTLEDYVPSVASREGKWRSLNV